MKKHGIAEGLLLTCAMAWGGAYVVSAPVLQVLGVYQFLGLRFCIAAVCFWMVFLPSMLRLRQATWLFGTGIGCIMLVIIALIGTGMKYSAPSSVALLFSLYILIVPLMDFLLFRTRPSKHAIVGAGIAFVGALVLRVSQGGDWIGAQSIGFLCGLLAAIGSALNVVLLVRYGKEHPPQALGAIQMTVVGLVGIMLSFVLQETWEMPVILSYTKELLYVGLIAGFYAFLVQMFMLPRTEATTGALLLSLQSSFALLFAIIWGLESFQWLKLVSLILVFAGVLVSQGSWIGFAKTIKRRVSYGTHANE